MANKKIITIIKVSQYDDFEMEVESFTDPVMAEGQFLGWIEQDAWYKEEDKDNHLDDGFFKGDSIRVTINHNNLKE